jgi:hypothetical protein
MEILSMLILILALILGAHGERIRLYGIDTPECRTRDAEKKLPDSWRKEFVSAARRRTYRLQTKEKGKLYLGTIFDRRHLDKRRACKERLAVPYFGQSKK